MYLVFKVSFSKGKKLIPVQSSFASKKDMTPPPSNLISELNM